MKNPQTLAEKLADKFPDKKLINISKYGCCAFVLLWCLGIEPDEDAEAILILSDLIEKGKIKEDCTVKWVEAVKYLTGRTVTAVDFNEIKIIGNIKNRTPVRYDYGKNSHWVGVEYGEIKFNPLSFSNCVEFGRPAESRVLHIKGVN
jgi:hypothetical protein